MQQHVSAETSRHPLWLLAGFWFCVVISIGVVLRRLIELIRPSHTAPPEMASLDAIFSSHAVLTAMHIIPAAIFVLLSAALLVGRSGGEWLEWLFFPFGAITGATAYAMSYWAVGGWVERSAVLVFNTWFLFSLGRAYWFRLRREPSRKREWMTRAVGILLGIATTRPVMGVFFATSSRTHLGPQQFFGVAFWIGFSINASVIELWLHSKRRTQIHQLQAVL
ncbi:MAG: DUF2306 domain-containing protein [Acidobacteriaceae bacterium]|nr:DUF2306 domain-containing protein [Acidobacteriaceae bacterium]MBV9778524.1 DUF2306 domain-containing protein [Acidobacteriaceae bacterium]